MSSPNLSQAAPASDTPTKALLRTLKYSGIVATIMHTIELEKEDERTNGTKGTESRLSSTPKQAMNQLLHSLSDIPEVSMPFLFVLNF